jgi:hypothetical protein
MALLPVICGTLWAAPNVIGGDATNVQFLRVQVGPCPQCGGMGTVPDGVYSLVDDTIRAVGSIGPAGPSREALQSLIDLLTRERDVGSSPSEISDRVSDELPEFAGLFSQLTAKMGSSAGVAAWLAVVIALLQWLVSCSKDQDVKVVINQTKTPAVIERVCEDLDHSPMLPPTNQGR